MKFPLFLAVVFLVFLLLGCCGVNAVLQVFLGVYSQQTCCVIKTFFCSCVSQQICLKGKVHIFKFLSIQACLRIDKKPDSLDLPSLGKRIPSQPLTDRWVWGFWVQRTYFGKDVYFFMESKTTVSFILMWVFCVLFFLM